MKKICLAKLQISLFDHIVFDYCTKKYKPNARISVGNHVLISIHNVRKNYMLIFAYYSNKAISPLFDDLQYSLFIVCLHLYKEKKNWLYVQTKL